MIEKYFHKDVEYTVYEYLEFSEFILLSNDYKYYFEKYVTNGNQLQLECICKSTVEHLDAFKYAMKKGAIYSNMALNLAAKNNHINILHILKKQGHVADELRFAAYWNSDESLEYLLKKCFYSEIEINHAIQYANSKKNKQLLKSFLEIKKSKITYSTNAIDYILN